jgi:Predicted unusual protein kinase
MDGVLPAMRPQNKSTLIINRVPKVYRYFKLSEIGYLVMEFIDGIPLANIAPYDKLLVRNLAEALHHFATKVKASFPGPRRHGIPRGYLF